jgi:endo-1,4-beta-D-glucanase Y
MVIIALIAGHDPDAQKLFNGLWLFSRKFPSGIDARLMSWKIQNDSIVSGNDSAFDGDADIAYGLLLAHEQWGSSGAIHYKDEASEVMSGILASTIGTTSYLPKLGDWTNDNGVKFNQYTPRSSDFMPSHFRAFARASHDNSWNTVVLNSQSVINIIQENYSSVTGLLPEFIIDCQAISNCRPADPGWFEGEHADDYYYNAGRVPWRIGLDALLNDDAQSRAEVQKMIRWLATSTGGNVNQIKAGYQLNGTGIGNFSTSFFIAPFAVAAMVDANQQTFLNDLYAFIYNKKENYYEDSVNLLSMLAITANYWDPVSNDIPPHNDITPIIPIINLLLLQ